MISDPEHPDAHDGEVGPVRAGITVTAYRKGGAKSDRHDDTPTPRPLLVRKSTPTIDRPAGHSPTPPAHHHGDKSQVKQTTEGGSWHVTVNLTRTAMWYQTLGLVDPNDAGCDDCHSLREPAAYDAETPLGDIHMLAPPVTFSHTPPRWRDPILVPRGSSRPHWINDNVPSSVKDDGGLRFRKVPAV